MQSSVEQLAAFAPGSIPRAQGRTSSPLVSHESSRIANVQIMAESLAGDSLVPPPDSKPPVEHNVNVKVRHSNAPVQESNVVGVAAAVAATLAISGAEPADAATALSSAVPLFAWLQQLCAKASFGGLMASTGIYWWRAAGFGGGVEGKNHGPMGSMAMTFSSASLALLLIARWVESGHFPLSNMYESLTFLAWGVTAIHLYIARKSPGSAVVGALTSPLALGVTAGATLLLPKELQKASALVPALQSNWLMMHVSVIILSYACLLASSMIAAGYLVLTAPDDGFVGQTRNTVSNGLAKLRGQEEATTITDASAAVPEDVVVSASQPEKEVNPALSESLAWSDIQAVSAEGAAAKVLNETPEKYRSGIEMTNDLAYQCGILGWNFLTIGLISGAVWANEAWGSYWSWDPKETWALITWLCYSVYLHTRISPSYDDRLSNTVCFAGFIVTWVCYAGVNLMGLGTGSLHSYTR